LLKRLHEVELQDVQELVGNIAESLHIDFKQAPVGRSDADRKEFVADVTAFANASGGDIVFGVVEGPDAVASQITGISVSDLDVEERRLSEIIRNGTEPRFTDFEFTQATWPSQAVIPPLRTLSKKEKSRRPLFLRPQTYPTGP